MYSLGISCIAPQFQIANIFEIVKESLYRMILSLTLIEQKNYHFLAVTENLRFLKLVLESMTTPIRIPKIK